MQKLNRQSLRLISRPQPLLLGLVLAAANAVALPENVEKTPYGLRIKLGQVQAELASVNAEAMRLSVASNGAPKPAASSFLATNSSARPAAWSVVQKTGMVGIETPSGRLLMDPASGQWTLEDAQGKELIAKSPLLDAGRKSSATNARVNLTLALPAGEPVSFYGSGNGTNSLQQVRGISAVRNGEAVIPYYWCSAGYAALAVSANDNRPASWRAPKSGEALTWTFPGPTADLYLMPAASLKAAAQAYAQLTGQAPVPPRWAFGYLQSRWGWKDRAYIEDTLRQFQTNRIPVDAFIYDFEWYTAEPDYELKPQGDPAFKDFSWNPKLFPEPAAQVAAYRNQGVRFVGIRKPRLGNQASLELIRTNGWDLQGKAVEKFDLRDIDFACPELRSWYIEQSGPLFKLGIDGWWNDEGEGSFTTYYYWNQAEADAMARYRPGCRLWTLNRAFSPGTQRFGAGAWTGDIKGTWTVLGQTPTSLLNWGLAGMPYGACDSGGYMGTPSPELLSRWIEAAAFFPIMRAHSEIKVTPRFPWLFGPEAMDAIRKAIVLRYRLIPFYYSLAHETFATGVPWMRPMAMEFPQDPECANLSDQWLMGRSLLAAPVLQAGGKRSVYLPSGQWYTFDTNTVFQGNGSREITARLDEIPLYVRAGTLLPLAPAIQHTSELPGGPLELQIYPGQNASFTFVEDDGETTGYQKGHLRRTVFTWDDSARRLKWKRSGDYAGKDCFQAVRAVLLAPQGAQQLESPLKPSGKLTFAAKSP